MRARRFLCVGGPLDGEWRTLEEYEGIQANTPGLLGEYLSYNRAAKCSRTDREPWSMLFIHFSLRADRPN